MSDEREVFRYIMAVYYVALALIAILAFPLCIWKPARWKKIIYLAVVFCYLWAVATFRSGIGFDYQIYIDMFNNASTPGYFTGVIKEGFEPVFFALNAVLSRFTSSSVVMYGVYEALMLIPVAWFIYKYCKDAWFASWLYVTLTFFYTTMNFSRQSLAASVSLLGYRFLIKKKVVPYMLIVLLAAGFHKTALILIPVYFLCHLKLNWKLGAVYGAASLAVFLTSGLIIDFVTDYVFSGYKGTPWLTDGFPLQFLVIPAAVFGTCLALKPVWEKRDPNAGLLLNMMLFSFIIWFFITRHFIIERFSMYVYIYVLTALPGALSSLKAGDSVIAERDTLAAELKNKKAKPSKEQSAALAKLNQSISDGGKYYWCAVAAVAVLTFIYHDFGANVNGFHGVFPYQSIF